MRRGPSMIQRGWSPFCWVRGDPTVIKRLMLVVTFSKEKKSKKLTAKRGGGQRAVALSDTACHTCGAPSCPAIPYGCYPRTNIFCQLTWPGNELFRDDTSVAQGGRAGSSAQRIRLRAPTSNCPMRAPAVFGGSLSLSRFSKGIKEIFVRRE
jgi:hypothetical protein